ncbi:2-oxo acid dehydrogenase subunit E2 [Caldinitratiruptor microaerophilus]|uniref:Dihydrolipoamide acetyltransferase component of pyruvate dehydrogenase complex n=1 Tax=Caldinitratiruptor microaerophilus TaxID=671077 RepID=A0AA35CKJ7_9FIRM|nr:2-oxo acid dehydrogenase subunit E2 [Caldinitratiruptor microaerophilus]BDG60219.1 hypothetical protein caldi_13090 [Caldinitratiruptor microaerophilus]
MSASVVMPAGGTVLQWLKRPGDWVAPGEAVVTVAVGGAAHALPAPAGGVLAAALVRPGSAVAPGEDLAYISPAVAGPGGQRLLPWDHLRLRIAHHMQYSSNAAAHVTTGVEVDVSRLQSLRRALRERGMPIGLTPFLVRAAAEALLDWPCLNGQVTPLGLVLPDRVNICVPVDVPGGVDLIVLRDAPYKTVSHLAAELRYLSALARAGYGGPHISEGGTFTVTNPGSLGSVWGTAVINQPNCAILACQAVVDRPVALPGGRIEVRPVMNLSLSFDHRALDGVVTLGFLNRVREVVEAANVPV